MFSRRPSANVTWTCIWSYQVGQTHPLMEVHSVADEGRVVDEAEAAPVLRHFAPEQQLLVQLHADAGLKHPLVAQAVDHDDHIVVELTNGSLAEVKGLCERQRPT